MDDDRGLKLGDDPGNPFVVVRASKLEVGTPHPPSWRFKIEASNCLDLVVALKRPSNTRTDG